MSETVLKASPRSEFGKGAARRIRREDKIPAVIYGHGMEPVHVTLPGHQTMMAVKVPNALISVDVEGGGKHLTVVKNVQREVIRRYIEHVDFLAVVKGEKIEVDVPLHVEGEPAAGGVANVEFTSIALKSEATAIPEAIVFSIAGAAAGTTFKARDLSIPEGSELAVKEDLTIATIQAKSAGKGEEEEDAAAEASEEAAE